ncbi:MAG: hypothetical protein P8Y97_11410 [Candidatus Lokiarchaeota archaeon]
MIRDVLVIKDGLPLFTKNFSTTKNIIRDPHNVILVSGFLSALNSFSEEFENLGSIQELKLSGSNLRLSFLKDASIPNLIFLASFDEDSKTVNIQRFLRKMSRTFLRKYNLNQIINWSGKSGIFNSFEEEVERYVEEEYSESDEEFKGKVENLFKNIEEKFQNQENYLRKMSNEYLEKEDKAKGKNLQNEPSYHSYIPNFKMKEKPDPRYYLTGKKSINVFKEIDGNKSIRNIAESLFFIPFSDFLLNLF